MDDLTTGLPEAHRPAGRLALLVAFASYQVDEKVIDGCRQAGADDATLVELCAWAAMAAARRAGTLLPLPTTRRAAPTIKPDSDWPDAQDQDSFASGH